MRIVTTKTHFILGKFEKQDDAGVHENLKIFKSSSWYLVRVDVYKNLSTRATANQVLFRNTGNIG